MDAGDGGGSGRARCGRSPEALRSGGRGGAGFVPRLGLGAVGAARRLVRRLVSRFGRVARRVRFVGTVRPTRGPRAVGGIGFRRVGLRRALATVGLVETVALEGDGR